MECKSFKNYKAHNCRHQCVHLPESMTCAEWIHAECFTTFFDAEPENTSCGWKPVRFRQNDLTMREEMKRDGVYEADIDRATDLIRSLREQPENEKPW